MRRFSTRRSSLRGIRRGVTFFLLAAAWAGAAAAGTFTVTLTNGTTFETRYRPTAAEWDEDIALIATDHGNWIALLKEEIADITSSVEESGFGYQVDTTTLFVGWAPVDLEEEGEDAAGQAGQGAPAQPVIPQLPGESFTVEQFVAPPTSPGTITGGPADIGF